MGNTASNNKQQPPPPYEEINEKQILDAEPIIDDLLEKPITADTIIKERKEFKDKQLDVYEKDFKFAQNDIIKSINALLSAAKTKEKFEVKLWLLSGTYIDVKYQDVILTKLYLQKRLDFVKNMYPGFEITIIDEQSYYYKIHLLMTLKES